MLLRKKKYSWFSTYISRYIYCEEDVDKTTLETSEEYVDKTTLETSEEYVDKTTLETSEEDAVKLHSKRVKKMLSKLHSKRVKKMLSKLHSKRVKNSNPFFGFYQLDIVVFIYCKFFSIHIFRFKRRTRTIH